MTDLKNFVIRADYYDDGSIVPISVTFNKQSHFVNHILKNVKGFNTEGSIVTYIDCISGNIRFSFAFADGKWECQYEAMVNT